MEKFRHTTYYPGVTGVYPDIHGGQRSRKWVQKTLMVRCLQGMLS